MVNLKNKISNLSIYGIIILLTTPFIYILLFAIFATIFGEDKLELEGGVLSNIGQVLFFLPIATGLGLIVFDLTYSEKTLKDPTKKHISKNKKRLSHVLGSSGLILISLSVVSFLGSSEGGANIGGGLIFMTGLVLLLSASFTAIKEFNSNK